MGEQLERNPGQQKLDQSFEAVTSAMENVRVWVDAFVNSVLEMQRGGASSDEIADMLSRLPKEMTSLSAYVQRRVDEGLVKIQGTPYAKMD
jgi:hypothetical protein